MDTAEISDFYNPMLADFEGDPEANSRLAGRTFKKVLESKGQWMDRDGDVHSVKPVQPAARARVRRSSGDPREKGQPGDPDLLRADRRNWNRTSWKIPRLERRSVISQHFCTFRKRKVSCSLTKYAKISDCRSASAIGADSNSGCDSIASLHSTILVRPFRDGWR